MFKADLYDESKNIILNISNKRTGFIVNFSMFPTESAFCSVLNDQLLASRFLTTKLDLIILKFSFDLR